MKTILIIAILLTGMVGMAQTHKDHESLRKELNKEAAKSIRGVDYSNVSTVKIEKDYGSYYKPLSTKKDVEDFYTLLKDNSNGKKYKKEHPIKLKKTIIRSTSVNLYPIEVKVPQCDNDVFGTDYYISVDNKPVTKVKIRKF